MAEFMLHMTDRTNWREEEKLVFSYEAARSSSFQLSSRTPCKHLREEQQSLSYSNSVVLLLSPCPRSFWTLRKRCLCLRRQTHRKQKTMVAHGRIRRMPRQGHRQDNRFQPPKNSYTTRQGCNCCNDAKWLAWGPEPKRVDTQAVWRRDPDQILSKRCRQRKNEDAS